MADERVESFCPAASDHSQVLSRMFGGAVGHDPVAHADGAPYEFGGVTPPPPEGQGFRNWPPALRAGFKIRICRNCAALYAEAP